MLPYAADTVVVDATAAAAARLRWCYCLPAAAAAADDDATIDGRRGGVRGWRAQLTTAAAAVSSLKTNRSRARTVHTHTHAVTTSSSNALTRSLPRPYSPSPINRDLAAKSAFAIAHSSVLLYWSSVPYKRTRAHAQRTTYMGDVRTHIRPPSPCDRFVYVRDPSVSNPLTPPPQTPNDTRSRCSRHKVQRRGGFHPAALFSFTRVTRRRRCPWYGVPRMRQRFCTGAGQRGKIVVQYGNDRMSEVKRLWKQNYFPKNI